MRNEDKRPVPYHYIYPQMEGDCYYVEGYPASGMGAYGVAVYADDELRPGYVTFNLAMHDGDYFPWPPEKALPDMPCDSVRLVRRMADIQREDQVHAGGGEKRDELRKEGETNE